MIWRRDDAGKLVLTERVSGVFTSTGDGIADPMCTLQNCAKDGVVQVLLGKHILPLVGEFTDIRHENGWHRFQYPPINPFQQPCELWEILESSWGATPDRFTDDRCRASITPRWQ